MSCTVRNILCRAFVAPGVVTVNAVVSYDPATMTLISAKSFEKETASTSHFDGIVINGLPMNNADLTVTVNGFRERLAEIAGLIEKSDRIILQPLS